MMRALIYILPYREPLSVGIYERGEAVSDD